MKTPVSIPDDIFHKAEKLAKRPQRSRSEVFTAALREYLARHAPDEVTNAMNQACDAVADQSDRFLEAASRRSLAGSAW